jgi:hypothetical protein
MMPVQLVRVRELVAWGVDENIFRPQIDGLQIKVKQAHDELVRRDGFMAKNPISHDVPAFVMDLLEKQLHRADLHEEMKGLDWTTGIVDLRQLLAFQRRLIFDETFDCPAVPSADDWSALVAFAFGPAAPIAYHTVTLKNSELLLQSENPNLQFRASTEADHLPFLLHGGSPFFEVAEFGGRWFLRDGYHRAYRLLRAGVVHVPAVIVRARTLVELGPVQSWFFNEEILFDSHPPRVTDFLDDNVTVEYNRPRLFKTLRVKIEESVEPTLFTSNSGERQ